MYVAAPSSRLMSTAGEDTYSDSTDDFACAQLSDDSAQENYSDVDLDELYESFDYDNSSQGSTSSDIQTRSRDEVDETALYAGAQVTVLQAISSFFNMLFVTVYRERL